MRLLLSAITASALALHATPSRAQSACDDALIRQANDARRAGRDGEALPLLQHAWTTCHTPRALAQVGLTEAALGRWLDASRDLRAAIAAHGDPWVVSNLPRVTEALARVETHLGRVTVVVRGPAGATAQVGGHTVRLPQREPRVVAEGRVAVEVRAPGHPSFARVLAVSAGQSIVEEFDLSSTAPTGPADALSRVPALAPPTLATARPPPPRGAQRVLAWTSLALGVLAASGSTAALVLRADHAAAFNADRACGAYGGAVRGGPDCVERYDAGADLQSLAIAGFAVGGALAVTAVVLFATAPSPTNARPDRAHVACSPSLAAPGITCGATF